MKFFAFFLAAAACVSVFGASMHRYSAKDFKTKQQSIYAEAAPVEPITTIQTNAMYYPRANVATSIVENTALPTLEYRTAADWLRKFGPAIAARFARKLTTAAAAKSKDNVDCWTVNGNMPEECVDNSEGKGQVYTTQKDQKKNEDLEQAMEETKMWQEHLHWDGNVYDSEAN